MPSFNRVILAGNLTRAPELSYTPNNTAVCGFGLAVNRKWRDRDGNQQEDTCFVDCTAFAKAGETLNQYLRKGNPVLVEGRLRYRQWQDKAGQNRSKLEVVVEGFTFLGGGEKAPPARQDARSGRAATAAPPAGDVIPPADIPF